jgi:cysteine-rich repeat protein
VSVPSGMKWSLLAVFGVVVGLAGSADAQEVTQSRAAAERSAGELFTITEEEFVVGGGAVELLFDDGALARLGLKADRVDAGNEVAEARFDIDTDTPDTRYEVLSANGELGALPGGSILARGKQVNLSARAGRVVGFDTLYVVHHAFGSPDGDWVMRSGADGGEQLFEMTTTSLSFDYGQQEVVFEGRVAVSGPMAERLGTSKYAGRVVGRFTVTLELRLSRTTVTGPDKLVESVTLHPLGGTTAAGTVLGPDVIVGDLPNPAQYGRTGTPGSGRVGLAVGTTSCNIGDVPFNWFALPNGDHPMIPMNLYRLKTVAGTDRFEQMGHSWMKHGFVALQGTVCSSCTPTGGTFLGVGCSDPYSSPRNAGQCGLGARAQLNPYTGASDTTAVANNGPCGGTMYVVRDHSNHTHDAIAHRVQVEDVDLMPSQNSGARYFFEAQYLTPHEFTDPTAFANQNMHNNASHREVIVTEPSAGNFSFSNAAPTVRELPAVTAWTGSSSSLIEPAPTVDGRAFVYYKVTDLGGGTWHYEYAVYNMNLDRSIQSFSVPIPGGVITSNIGFHAPRNHTDPGVDPFEEFSNTAWSVDPSGGAITWSTETFAANPQANAIRFGTLYNFRFDANSGPQNVNATVGMFKIPGTVTPTVSGPLPVGPQDCNNNGTEDTIDIANGTSQDCTGNGVPDECEQMCTLTSRRVATGLSSPLFATSPPGDLNRLFIVQQGGQIRILDLGTETILATPFLTVSPISTGGERGLLSMAFDPNYQTNARFYVNYTNSSGNTVVAQYTTTGADPAANTADAGSAVILKTITQDFSNHNGGQLQFGSDGFLYVGMGDGGAGDDPNNRAQNLGSLLGKMLRLDVDNPPTYVAAGNPFGDEIWSYGLRNPWRFSFDALTGDMYIGDVGQNTREEIDFEPAGVSGTNYGWDCREGSIATPTNSGGYGCVATDPTLTDPIYDVALGVDGTCSITGGYVYRGCDIPGLSGTYFFSDYCGDYIKTFRYAGGIVGAGDITNRTTELTPDVGSFTSIVSFGEDGSGAMYIVSLNGSVFKIICAGAGPVCGNGVLENGEACDDGNTTPGDGCDANCQIEVVCQTALYEERFDTDPGWTVTNDASLTAGAWVFGDPAGDGTRNDPIDDFDGGGACYLTENAAGNTDVDGGPTQLTSPVIDMSAGNITLSYAYWFVDTLATPDSLEVEVSVNGGSTWTTVASHTTSQGAWRTNSVALDALVTPTANSMVRFSVADNPNDSILEAAIDAVVISIPCADCNLNGRDDLEDISCLLAGTCGATPGSFDCNTNSIPDECESGGLTEYPVSPALAILDNQTVSDTFTVPNAGTIQDIDVDLNISHTWNGDLLVQLTHGGTTVTLIDSQSGDDDGYNVVLDDEGTGGTITTASGGGGGVSSPPSYTPTSPLSAFDGLDAQGDWTISITDRAAQDQGTLNVWTLKITTPGVVIPCSGDFIRGGRLYDKWYAEMGAAAPTTDHPLWQFRPDQVSNTRTGADTWRCKECHGWDYLGVNGQYGTGSHRTGIPGVLGSTLTFPELTTLLSEPPNNGGGAGVLNGHDYGSVMNATDISDVVSFVLSGQGAIDDTVFIDASAAFIGNITQGRTNYETGGSLTCITCHGADGTSINLGGTPQNPQWVGTHATENPWEVLHKIRFAQPATPMPSWLQGGKTNQGAADIGAYVQSAFPVDCTNDGHCDDGLFCSGTETCDGRFCVAGSDPCPGQACDEPTSACVDCVVDPDCADSVFCNGAETCVGGACVPGSDPCPGQICVEAGGSCVDCLGDNDCDDSNFCNGVETCSGNTCQAGSDPCPGLGCDEVADTCLCLVAADCDDGLFCNGAEGCNLSGQCVSGTPPCVAGEACDEGGNFCATSSRMFLLPAGVDPTTTTPGQPFDFAVAGGSTLTVEVYLEQQAISFTGYSIATECTYDSSVGGAGAVTPVIGSVMIDVNRPDYAFASTALPAIDQGQCDDSISCTIHADCPPGNSICIDTDGDLVRDTCSVALPRAAAVNLDGDVAFVAPKYLAAFDVDIPVDAVGDYLVLPACEPGGGCAALSTFLQSLTGAELPFTIDGLSLSVPVGRCCHDGDMTPPLECVETTAAECVAVFGGVFTANETCDGAGPCDCTIDCDCVFPFEAGVSPGSDVCMAQVCEGGGCTEIQVRYGDVDAPYGGTVGIGDILCGIAGFQNYCDCPRADIAGCVVSGGTIGVADILAIVDGFSGVDPCGCEIPNPPSPGAASGAVAHVQAPVWFMADDSPASISLVPVQRSARGGDVFTVDVFVSDVSLLAGYELALVAEDGRRGSISLAAAWVDTERDDYVFAGSVSYPVSDLDTGRIGAVIGDARVDVSARRQGYLGTFAYRLSSDAVGPFVVSVVQDGVGLWRSSIEEIAVQGVKPVTVLGVRGADRAVGTGR